MHAMTSPTTRSALPQSAPDGSEQSPPAGALSTTDRTRLRIHPERSAPDELMGILRDGLVAHVAIADEAGPVVIPMTYHFHPEHPRRIYIHGAHHSRLMKHVASGAPVCVSVTLVDGLVYSRSARYHSVNYRSAICFGTARVVDDLEEQQRAAEGIVERYFPGRIAGVDYLSPPEEHLKGTAILAIEVTDASAKIRRGGPKGPLDHDPTAIGSAGVLHFDPPR
jgi:uncharacterized protein